MQRLSNFNDNIQLFNLPACECEIPTRTMEFEAAKLAYRPHIHAHMYVYVCVCVCLSMCSSITSTINTLTHTGCGFTQRVYVTHIRMCLCVYVCVAWLIKNVLRINIIALGIQLND